MTSWATPLVITTLVMPHHTQKLTDASTDATESMNWFALFGQLFFIENFQIRLAMSLTESSAELAQDEITVSPHFLFDTRTE